MGLNSIKSTINEITQHITILIELFALFSIINKPSKCIPDLLLFSRNIITHESFPKVICHSWLKIALIAVIITQHKNYSTIRTIFKNAHFPITNSYSCIFPCTKPIAYLLDENIHIHIRERMYGNFWVINPKPLYVNVRDIFWGTRYWWTI